MIDTLIWYVIISAIGWLAWPLLFRLLPRLPDRGYTFSRATGLLLIGYAYWLPGTLGLLRNSVGGILLAALLVGGAVVWAVTRGPERPDLSGWLKANRAPVLTAEALFAVAFFGWAIFRSFNPDILGTEKPMELAFLNGFRLSPDLPPRDPWLAGYAISYYYFGYVLIGMLADLGGTASAVAFNLGNALLFALTLLGAFGLIYNLLAARSDEQSAARSARGALLAPLFVGVMGNLAGLLELLRALPAFGARFWAWLDILDLNTPAGGTLWPPSTWRNWWWWRASRVIHDRDVLGASIGLQPIDEFPFFSFLLGDMHPHVLALPFVMAALGLALHAATPREPEAPEHESGLRSARIALYVLVFGGLAFLNTWDLPIYLFVLVGALIVRRIRERGWFDPVDVLAPIGTGIAAGALGLIAYLPWLISFGSQAGGVLPNAIFATRFHQLFVMFGPLLVICVWFVMREAVRLTRMRRADWRTGSMLALSLLVGIIVLAAGLSIAVLRTSPEAAAFALSSTGTSDAGAAAGAILRHRLTHPLTPIALGLLIATTLAATLTQPVGSTDDDTRVVHSPPYPASTGFALVLILTGALLTLGPEFLYLRDNFGQRLNTIFKFYYAAWIVWALAAAYGAAVLLETSTVIARGAFAAVLIVLVLAGLVYPALAIPGKANGFTAGDGWTPTLDGIAYMEAYYPGDYNGIRWLQENAPPDAVVLEAVGGAYSQYGRVSSATGIPTLLGWANHERQWRGERYADYAGTREQDVQEIYNTRSIERAEDLLARYGVTYVFVGALERNPEYASPAGLAKFDEFLTPVYADEGVTIYRADLTSMEARP
jgi:YYY domain-containing protein